MKPRISHVIGFDDAPFDRGWRGDVLIVGAVFAGARLEGVLSAEVRRDGANSTSVLIGVVAGSRFAAHLQAIFVQGVAFAGFNVIDLRAVSEALGVPVIAVARKPPDYAAVRRALRGKVRGGVRKLALLESLGPMAPVADVYVQCAGISVADAGVVIRRFAVNGVLPEPLRTAHLIAGGIVRGESRHRA